MDITIRIWERFSTRYAARQRIHCRASGGERKVGLLSLPRKRWRDWSVCCPSRNKRWRDWSGVRPATSGGETVVGLLSLPQQAVGRLWSGFEGALRLDLSAVAFHTRSK